MNQGDLRATLRAIASGEAVRTQRVHGTPVLNAVAVGVDQKAYAAWRDFVHSCAKDDRLGEPLAAPSATLTPLP